MTANLSKFSIDNRQSRIDNAVALSKSNITVPKLLDLLEKHYGLQRAEWPDDPYLFIVWWHCGYPASDDRCAKGWTALTRDVGTDPERLLATPIPKLSAALKPGGMVPELRAMRMKQIATRVLNECGGDLRASLISGTSPSFARTRSNNWTTDTLQNARKLLKKFPNIADPGADRILLFAGIAPIAAVPSNCPHVLVRILHGQERENYGVTYKEAQQEIAAGIASKIDARTRAYLLLKRHGQEICKTKPKCDICPVAKGCAYFAGKKRGRGATV